MSCKHACLGSVEDKKTILYRSRIPCDRCRETKFLWACLEKNCQFNGCGRKLKDHISEHFKKTNHPVAINLQSFRIWCHSCEEEIKLFTSADIKSLKKDHKKLLLAQTKLNGDKKKSDPKPASSNMDGDCESNSIISPRGLTGLRNLGNTCYMNAALQAISNCPPLTYYFLGEYAECEESQHSSMTQHYYKLLAQIWNPNFIRKQSCITPSGVHAMLKTINPSFRGYQQQDAQEFLRCFMDSLHEELKFVVPRWTYDDMDSESGDNDAANTDSKDDKVDMRNISGDHADNFNYLSESQSLMTSEVSNVSAASQLRRKRQVSENELHGSKHGDSPSPRPSSPTRYPEKQSRRPSYRFRSVISEIFDGGLRSSVQCLTCDQVSHTREAFQDLSLPIPGKDDLARLHTPAGASCSGELAVNPGFNGPCIETARISESWYNYAWDMWEWLKGWFWGPQVTLNDCLSAFFSADELKGDNMYSCNKCNKLRNGVKYCKLLQLPEVLCIHLKRFRHEYQTSYSSKISSPVSFPINGLDLSKYLAQDNPSSCTTYDLCSIIVHHGNAGGGHYTAYAKNMLNKKWYEFDDKYVTEVPESMVANAEAYVLFYQKYSMETVRFHDRILQKPDTDDILQFYVSLHWWRKFWSYTEPGEIDNSDFLCRHSGVLPELYSELGHSQFAEALPKAVWELLHAKFGGGPAVTELSRCKICERELEALILRREVEDETFRKLQKMPSSEVHQFIVYISLDWFHDWEAFIRGTLPDPPGRINNRPICIQKDGKYILRKSSLHAPITRSAWEYLVSIYGGGPEVPHPIYVAPVRANKRSATNEPAPSSSVGTNVSETNSGCNTTTCSTRTDNAEETTTAKECAPTQIGE